MVALKMEQKMDKSLANFCCCMSCRSDIAIPAVALLTSLLVPIGNANANKKKTLKVFSSRGSLPVGSSSQSPQNRLI